MNGHLLIVALLLISVSYTDLKERRIPNRFLITATMLHILLDIIGPGVERIEYLQPSIISALLILVLASLKWRVIRFIGMGDVKLIIYLIFFFFPWIEMNFFFIGLGVVSIASLMGLFLNRRLTMEAKAGPWKSSLPFAPIVMCASGLAIALG